jgi:asparagine synthase (glutamine-hydrolysing)
MCGIAGIVSADSDRHTAISKMLDSIKHRGPDDEGTTHLGGVTLGHRRLSIIDLAGGHQPIGTPDRKLWIVFNGEIYNYKQLRDELASDGVKFSTESDTEVLLRLYEQHGVDCLQRIRGMFAFAIWDERRKRLFCARDHLGQKPLYYARDGSELLFGSEIKAVLAAKPELRRLNAQALHSYLSFKFINPPNSMFEGVNKLPPGHMLLFSPESDLEIRSYWTLSYGPKWNMSDDELVDRLEDELIEALKLHLVSDVPVGAFMSGGLDSTLLVAMLMKHAKPSSLSTFSFGLPYGDFNEAPYAKLVAEKYGTDHHERIITPSLVENLGNLIWQLDEPSDSLSVCTYLLAEFAAKYVKVVIGGDGGDELFGGYDRYYGNQYASLYAKIPAPIRSRIIGPILELIPDGSWYKSKAHQMKWLQDLSFRSGSDRYMRSLSYFYFGSDWVPDLYMPEFASRVNIADEGIFFRNLYDNAQASDQVDRMLYADSVGRLPDHPVMISDRMTMAHSLECRSPFMDHKIAEFSARLPVSMKVRGRKLRIIQRRLAERYLPREVLERPKQGFSSALPYMLKKEYELLCGVFLKQCHLADAGILKQDTINRVVDEHRSGHHDHGNKLWLLINSECWYRMYLSNWSKSDIDKCIRDEVGTFTGVVEVDHH